MFLRVDELHPGGALAASGAIPASQSHGYDAVHFFRTSGPAADPVEDDGGHVRVTQVPSAPRGFDPPYAPRWVTNIAFSSSRRHPRGEPCTDPDGVARRVKDVEGLIAGVGRTGALRLPARGLSPETDALEPFVDFTAAMLLEQRALSADVVVSVLVDTFKVPEPLATLRTRKTAEEPLGLWPWDERGQELDTSAREEQLARLRAEKRAAEEAARDAAPNTKTCGELGIFVARRHLKAIPNALTPAGRASFEHDGFAYFAIDTSALLGLAIPAGSFDDTVGEVLPESFVLPMSAREARQCPRLAVQPTTIAGARRGKIDATPITEFRDLRSAEGAWAVEMIAERFEPFVALAANSCRGRVVQYHGKSVLGGGFYFELLAQAYARTKIRKDVAWTSFLALVEPLFYSTVDGPEIVGPARTVYVDVLGKEHDEPFLVTTVAGVGEVYLDQYHEPMAPKVYVETRTKRPLPITAEKFSAAYDRAVAGGPSVLIGADELLSSFEAPPQTFVEKLLALVRPDPWRTVISDMVRRSDGAPIRSSEIEDELRKANLVERLNDEGHARVLRIMKKLGRAKKQPVIDGRRQAAFVPEEAGE